MKGENQKKNHQKTKKKKTTPNRKAGEDCQYILTKLQSDPGKEISDQ